MNAHHDPDRTSDSDELDALYAAWSDDRRSPTPTPLKQWMVKEPGHAAALAQWTTDSALLAGAESLPLPPEIEAAAESAGKRSLAAYAARTSGTEARIKSLQEIAVRQGLTLKRLADTLELGLPIVAKLEQRLLTPDSIPGRLIDRLAAALQLSRQQVQTYLARPATLSSAALYRADSAPRAGAQESFDTAIRTCPGMTEAQKRAWLAPEDRG